MKKGFSLIELIFAMVVIGICIAAIPKIVNASLESDEISYKQEYFYEVKELYGLIRNLPYNNNNVAIDDYKKNSLLSQFITACNVGSFKPKYEVSELSLININPRYGRAASSAGNELRNVLATCKAKTCNNVSITNALGQNFEYKFGKYSKVDKKYKFKADNSGINRYLKHENNNIYAGAGGCDAMSVMVPLEIYDDTNTKFLSFNTFYHTFGRLDSIYSQYPMMTQDSTWQTTNEDKLKNYLSL